ncbi:glycoprotein 3-alpha-L-fucosyltransferase A-like [Tachypleus tridentatus]|uniref:glycoprotein 3-alpha-L-fucosyltransferase A-like n=1 Tax=Tachypleus tridentatus TaxID=6853 RepID=UPI003FD350DD
MGLRVLQGGGGSVNPMAKFYVGKTGESQENRLSLPGSNITRQCPEIVNLMKERRNLRTVSSPRKSLQLDLFYDRGNFSSCEYKNCILKEDKASMNDSDAVLIPYPELQLPPTTNRRRSEQVWVFWAKDGPFYPRRNRFWEIKYLNSINWTITYRRDSDIIYKGYGQVKKKSRLKQFQESIVPFDARKDRLVAWFVSHCQTKSHREEYVLKLRQYISVDIVGPCNFSNSQCLPKRSTDCYNWLEEHYKFYLAFENKICKDYISEKFFAPLSRYVVPVVLGGGDYSSMAPSGSYIDVRDFKSPKDLADFLDVLDRYIQKSVSRYKGMVGTWRV